LFILFISLGIVYFLIGLAAFILFAPLKINILGISFSLASMIKPARVSLGLLLLGYIFRYLFKKEVRPELTLNQILVQDYWFIAEFLKQYQRCLNVLLYLFLFAGMIYFTGYKVRQHITFDTTGYDLSICDHAFYNTFHGDFLKAWGLDRNYFSQHFSPIFLIILPIYYFWQSPVLLLVIEGLVAGCTVLAFLLLGRRMGLPRWMALLSGFAFTFHPGYWEGFTFDFHQEMFFPLFFFLAVYFLLRGKMITFYIMSLFALMLREDVSFYLIVFGVYVMIKYSRKWGAILMGTSLLWAIVAIYIVIPLCYPTGQGQNYLIIERYGHYGSTYLEITTGILIHSPEILVKAIITSFRCLLKPLVYLPVLSPAYFLMGLFPIALNVCANSEGQAMLTGYYGVVGLAFFMLGFLMVLARLWHGTSVLKLISVVLLVYILFSLEVHPWHKILTADRMLAQQLKETSLQGKKISAGTAIIPHLPRENIIYMFPKIDDADLVILYMRPGHYYPWPLDYKMFFKEVVILLRNNHFRVISFGANILFMEKGERDTKKSQKVLRILEHTYSDFFPENK
jgi:uncharacterized membrane protein